MKRGILVALTLFLGCTSADLSINDTKGKKHYYGRKPKNSGEYYCFYHDKLERVESISNNKKGSK